MSTESRSASRRAGSRTRTTLAVLTVTGLAVTGLTACSHDDPPAAAQAVQPALTATLKTDDPVRIGVVVPAIEGDGSEFRDEVEGVRIATYQFGLGGTDVELAVALDDGTAAGAASAMQSLVDDAVAGVVLATQNDHVADALAIAENAETAVVLPYAQVPGSATSAASETTGTAGVWSVAPTAAAIRAQIEAALTEVGSSRPYLVATTGHELNLPTAQVTTSALDDPTALAQQIVEELEARQIDSLVISSDAQDQAALVVAVQELLGSRQMPIVLSPQALTPAFGDALTAAGSTAGRLLSVGSNTEDHVALTGSDVGDHAAAFFSALDLAAGDTTCENLYADDTCATGAPRADMTSHDATVALVRAVEAAGTVEPAAVQQALAGLTLGQEDGIVGPELDFGQTQALSDDDVVVLHASTSDPGLRPTRTDGTAAASLFWFAGDAG